MVYSADQEAPYINSGVFSGNEKRVPNIMSLLAIKVIAAVAILAVGAVGGLIPFLATRHHGSHRFFSLGNSLAGGVCVLVLIDRVLFETTHAIASEKGEGTRQPIYPVVLLVVLSIHSIIAGIALGLEAEVATSVLVMIAILFHKGSAAFALVVSAYASGADRRRLWTILTIFVLMTPLGIFLGTGASSLLEGRIAVLLEGSFNALAAGTFIYVAILDVINAEMSRRDDRIAHFVRSALIGEDDVPMPSQDTDRLFKFVLILVGLTCMAVLGIWM